jgi:hypothetical protein
MKLLHLEILRNLKCSVHPSIGIGTLSIFLPAVCTSRTQRTENEVAPPEFFEFWMYRPLEKLG